MSMNSNLPPGVSEGMIPGNRPEDVEDDAFWDALDEKLRRLHPDEAANVDKLWDQYETMFMAIAIVARQLGYDKGWSDAERLAYGDAGS